MVKGRADKSRRAAAQNRGGWSSLGKVGSAVWRGVFVIFAAFPLGLAHIRIGGGHRPRRPLLIGVAVCVHDAKVMLCMLV